MSQVSSLSLTGKLTLAVWLAMCAAVFAFTLIAYAPGPRSDAMVVFAWSMAALTFPSGLLVSALFVGSIALAERAGVELPFELGVVALWAVFSGVGYWQWFVAIPWLWRRTRQRGMPQNDA